MGVPNGRRYETLGLRAGVALELRRLCYTELMYAYTVTCEFTDPALAEQWVRWLRDEHLRKVCEAGALSAEVIHLDGMPEGSVRCEARYRFASRADFDRYERDHAPRLRQEGLERFPLSHGISYTRTTGEVVAHMD